MKLIIGTKNKAKLDQIKSALLGLDIDIQGLPDREFSEIKEDGQTVLENARLKAIFYSKAIGQPVLSMDNALYINGLSPDFQPGLNVRRINGRFDRPTDSELLEYYSGLITDLGGKVNGYWEYGICLAYPDGNAKETSIKSSRLFVGQPSKIIVEGYPLESIQVDPESGRYISEMSQLEQDSFWQKAIGRELCDFVASLGKNLD